MRVTKLSPQGRRLHEERVVAAIGNFDGIHLGHRKVLGLVIARAKAEGSTAAVLTFEPHPIKVLHPGADFVTLKTLEQRLELIAGLGIDLAVVVPFTPELARTEPESFVESLLVTRLGVAEVLVGPNFRFGRARRGDVNMLRALGRQHGFHTRVATPLKRGGAVVSSTRIRALIRDGAVAEAAKLLGRAHFIDGKVVRGSGRGSAELVATANLVTANECLPARGVYGGTVTLGRRTYTAASFVGRRRTFGEEKDVLEVHLLDWKGGDLYGRKLRLDFAMRVRGEQAFAGVAELKAQIERDLAQVRKALPR